MKQTRLHVASSSRVRRISTVAVLLAASSALLGCGPRVFESGSAKLIQPSAPIEEPEPEPRVEVTDNKIVIHEKIQFDYDKAKIKPESDDLLDEIAKVMNENQRIKKIRIEGHASSEGNYEHNVDLSKRRAKAVLDHLVSKGDVDKGRLVSEGYGPDRPIADNDTESGREANRRVEFTILEQEYTETKKVIDPETGEETVETEKKVD